MKKVIGAVITGALFAGLIVMLGRYDVAVIGPAGTEVGFSHINQFVHNLTGVNMIWYQITDFIGYGAIAVCGMFAVAGFRVDCLTFFRSVGLVIYRNLGNLN